MKVARTSMTSESWNFRNFNLLGAETFIQNPLSFPPPPKLPDLNLHAVANGFSPYDRQYHNTFRKRRDCGVEDEPRRQGSTVSTLRTRLFFWKSVLLGYT